MDDKYLSALEYYKIVQQLAEHTSFSASRELALALHPSADADKVRRWIQETTEARALLSTRTDVTVGGAHDVRPLARRAALQAMLQPPELLDVCGTLVSARSLRLVLMRVADRCPLLAQRASGIDPLSHVIDEIGRCLDDDGDVLDSASPELARIRRASSDARQRVLDRLRRIVTASENVRFLQEPIVTERHGRYVIPLKVEFKGRIAGIIHDQSSSGATLFIEPLVTVELNNRWHELQLAERREIDRILSELSQTVGEEADAIVGNVTALAELDLALAKAHYSIAVKGVPAEVTVEGWPVTKPDINLEPDEHPLNLVRARHPLLPREAVVPIDVYAGGDYTVLLVTGPNTGGKTVTLKTVGLLASMSQAGMHIPAAEGSQMPVFTGIYADIGDEQSIEQSLSTFSSHMTRIVDILSRADSGSLVLLDELGAGTDPVEGAALAQALIAALLERRCLTLCASHYSTLKVYAFDAPGVQNASVEFDVDTLVPTYHLVIGLPGRSNALAIASQLGTPTEIIEHARSLVSPEELKTDALLGKVKAAREAAELAQQEAEASRARSRKLERELRAKLASIEQDRRQVLERTREEGRLELARLRGEIRRIRAETRPGSALQVIQQASEAAEELEREIAPIDPIPQPPCPPPELLQMGDVVYVTPLQQTGEVLRIDGQDAEVQAGGFRLRAPLGSLQFRSRPEPAPQAEPPSVRVPDVASPGIELDLRGLRAEEVAPMLDKYLDNAYLAGLAWAHIIHGKGAGVLKSVVRQFVGNHPLVSSYRPGEMSEGGDGVTVVQLQALSQ